jgi:hypothetical protein
MTSAESLRNLGREKGHSNREVSSDAVGAVKKGLSSAASLPATS